MAKNRATVSICSFNIASNTSKTFVSIQSLVSCTAQEKQAALGSLGPIICFRNESRTVSDNATKDETTQDLHFAGLLHFNTIKNWIWAIWPFFWSCGNNPDSSQVGFLLLYYKSNFIILFNRCSQPTAYCSNSEVYATSGCWLKTSSTKGLAIYASASRIIFSFELLSERSDNLTVLTGKKKKKVT